MRIVVVSPHRGDAALSVGLAIAGWLEAGVKVEVLNTFTLTEHAPFSDVHSLHAHDKQSFATAVRKREDTAWNRTVGGKVRFTDLDMLDAPVRLGIGLEALAAEEIRAGDRAQARVAGALAKLARTAAASPAGGFAFVLPLAAGGHIDHRVVRAAGLEAVAATGLPTAFYEDWPVAATADESVFAQRAAETGLDLQPVFAPAEPVEREPLKSAAARKRRMVLAYDSVLDSEAVTAAGELATRHGGRERLWANAAWRETPPACVRG